MGQGRVELPTSRLSGVRSNHLSYWPGGGARTPRAPVGADHVFEGKLGPSKLNPITVETITYEASEALLGFLNRVGFDLKVFNLKGLKLLRKEVIQPQVPLRLPCYDFTPVTEHSLGTCLPCGLAQPLLEQSTPMV